MNVSFSLKGRIIVSFRSNFEIFISFHLKSELQSKFISNLFFF